MIAVAEELNFRKAAQRCHVTQPALSAQIQELENILGVRVFERDRRRVLPTAAGSKIIDRGRVTLAAVDDVVDTAQALSHPLCGDLKLGVIPTIASYFLPKALPALRKKYPECRLLLVEDQTQNLLEKLQRGDLDVLLLALEADLGSVTTLPLFEDEFWLVTPKSHRLAQRKSIRESDLNGESVLLLDDGHCLRDQTLGVCRSAGADEIGDFRASSLNTLVQMVANGVGITLLPAVAMEAELRGTRSVCARRFSKPRPYRTIALAWRPNSARADEFGILARLLTR